MIADLQKWAIAAPMWHERVRACLPSVELTLLIGRYAQAFYLGDRVERTLTETVRLYESFLPGYLVTPHPSPRNKIWLKKNPFFEASVIPILRARIHTILREVCAI